MVNSVKLRVNDVVKCVSLNEDISLLLEIGEEYIVIQTDKVGSPHIRVEQMTDINGVRVCWGDEEQFELIGRVKKKLKNGKYVIDYEGL